jgi:putative transposase
LGDVRKALLSLNASFRKLLYNRNMLKAYQYRLYPNKSQQAKLAKDFGACRWIWNNSLAECQRVYMETGKGLSAFDLTKRIKNLKQENIWLKETNTQSLNASCFNLSRSFINFFETRTNYPRFKCKTAEQTIQFPQYTPITTNRIHLPKIGKVRFIQSREFAGRIKTTTVRKMPSGKYFISILVDNDQPLPRITQEGKTLGIDLGLTSFVVISDGSKYKRPNTKYYEKLLHRRQRQLARKTKGSKGRECARIKVAKVYEKISNIRKDFLHKLSTKLVNENQVLVFEDLNVRGMTKNHCLAKAIQDSSWSAFIGFCSYKASWQGKRVVQVSRWFPSTKTCSSCMHQQKLTLAERNWTCEHCGAHHDRDINAAINIKAEGLRIFMAEGSSVTADGGFVSLNGRPKSTIKLKPLKSEEPKYN